MTNLESIKEKIYNNKRLSKEDGLTLYKSFDIIELGKLASFAKDNILKSQNKDQEKDFVYWINNHHLNITNICEGTCKFCAYRKKEGEEKAFLMTLEEATAYIKNNVSKKASEIHIVSALNPECDITYYKKLLENCRELLPDTHIQAFTAVEIDYIAKKSNLSIEETLKELIKSGLGSLPGGGAENFSPRLREQTCPDKISGEKWLEIMEIAHNLGLKSNVTMLSGINESFEEKIDHMLKVRELQDKTNGFMSFIPLFCHYENTELENINAPTGVDIIKDYAISRLMLDNIPHIKAFWIQIGIKLAQLSLSFGVDDLDGTVVEEKITHFAGAKTGSHLSKENLIDLIKQTGKVPVERDTIYNIIEINK